MKHLLMASTLLATPAFAQTQEVSPSLPAPEVHGLGFGLNGGDNHAVGYNGYYDLNLARHEQGFTQLHTSVAYGTSSRSSLLALASIETKSYRLNATYRFVLHSGFFIGAGLGYTFGELSYDAENFSVSSTSESYVFTHETVKYKSSFSSGFVNADLGWQGDDGYYFTVGLQPAVALFSDDDFDLEKIPDISNHRKATQEMSDDAKKSGLLYIGFGWYL